MTIVLTTHYLEEAEKLCERVVILKQGEVAREGKISELLQGSGAKSLEEFYLSV
jgi:ABC-2 type transport system ATP-binding protein